MIEYIWNGVGLTVPDGWEPSALERDGLFLECGGRPVCELKWRVIQGTFSFEKHLKRLVKEHKTVDMHGVPDQETPLAWQGAVSTLAQSGIRLQSFIWRIPGHKGLGAALHNPATGLAALVQFFIASDEDEAVAADVLASFRDYLGGKTIPWAMFGLRARISAEFVLDTFSFRPGHYTVKYWRPKSVRNAGKLPTGKGPGTALVFERFAPASVLLRDHPLDAWVRETLETAPSQAVPIVSGENEVAWAGVARTSLLRALLRREQHTMGQVWTTGTGNAIMIVTATGTVAMPGEIFNDIRESYELV